MNLNIKLTQRPPGYRHAVLSPFGFAELCKMSDAGEGAMKGGLSVGRRLEILCNVQRRLGNETVSVGLNWSECQVSGY